MAPSNEFDRIVYERQDRGPEVEAIEREITELSAHINAATYRLLVLIAEFDRREGWTGWGILSCAHWLNWKCGIGLNAAREKVRVARALPSLPLISAAFAGGVVSYSKVRAMTRVATPENEDYLLMIARHGTAAHVAKLVRATRSVQRTEEAERAEHQDVERSVHWYHDDDGSLVIQARLRAEQGALVLEALEATRERLDTETGMKPGAITAVTLQETALEPLEPFAARRADALVDIAEQALAGASVHGTGGDRHQVVVHVDAAALHGEDGRCEIDGGPWLATDTVRRLACDASLVRIVDGPNGAPLDVGRKTRSIPPAIRRALNARDSGCRFPGCTHEQFLDAHHCEHWADGGQTSLSNLATVCKLHHRMLHEGGYDVRVLDDGALRFTRPDGRAIPAVGEITAVTSGSVAALIAANRQAGLDIDAGTGESLWEGERMDLAMAVEGVLVADGRL